MTSPEWPTITGSESELESTDGTQEVENESP